MGDPDIECGQMVGTRSLAKVQPLFATIPQNQSILIDLIQCRFDYRFFLYYYLIGVFYHLRLTVWDLGKSFKSL